MIRIILNNNPVELQDEISIADLLVVQKFTFKMIIIKVNDKLIKKSEYDIIIKDGDKVDVIHLISGG